MSKTTWAAAASVAALVVIGLVMVLRNDRVPSDSAPQVPAAAVSAPVLDTATPASAPVALPTEPTAESAPVVPAPPTVVAEVSIESALADLVGRKAVLSWFQTDEFVRRVVATVDSLGRSHASPRLWPLNPVPGRFSTDRAGGREVVGIDNGQRYTPYVLLLETLDLRKAVDLYVRLSPRLQQAYVDLGFPRQRFHDRLLEVMDLLLTTPVPATSPVVLPPRVQGGMTITRPWVLYEFEDPGLQQLSAGQRILLRMGPVNQRRVTARLKELRSLLATAVPGR